MKKRLLAMLLVLMLVVSLLPVGALAADDGPCLPNGYNNSTSASISFSVPIVDAYKLLLQADESLSASDELPNIKNIVIKLKEAHPNPVVGDTFTLDKIGLAGNLTDYFRRAPGLNRDHRLEPSNIDKLVIYYEISGDEKAAEVQAKDLCLWYAKDGSIADYEISSYKSGTQIVVFCDNGESTDTSQGGYSIYAVRLVTSGKNLGENMPDPPDRISYDFVSWNTSPNGKGDIFNENTNVSSDIIVYARKVSSGGTDSGLQIRVMNDNNEFLTRFVELYNAKYNGNLTLDDIDKDILDSMKVVVNGYIDGQLASTNPDYYVSGVQHNGWADGYYKVYNRNASAIAGGQLSNDHIAINDITSITVTAKIKGTPVDVKMNRGSGAGEFEVSTSGLDAWWLIKFAGSPDKPESADLEGPDGILADSTVTVTCTTNEDHQTATYGLLSNSYEIGEVKATADGGYECTITVEPDMYVEEYGDDHALAEGETSEDITLVWDLNNNSWTVPVGATPVKFNVTCEPEPDPDPDPEPDQPTDKEIADLGLKVYLDCVNSNVVHADKEFGVRSTNSYVGEVVKDPAGVYTCTVTPDYDLILRTYNDQVAVGHDYVDDSTTASAFILIWDAETESWIAPAYKTITKTVTCNATAPAPELSVDKSVEIPNGKTTAEVDDTLKYTITLTNEGDADATNVVVTDTMWGHPGDKVMIDGSSVNVSSGSCTVTVPAGETVTIYYTYTVQDANAGTTLENTVTVTVNGEEGPTDNTETTIEPTAPTIDDIGGNDFKVEIDCVDTSTTPDKTYGLADYTDSYEFVKVSDTKYNLVVTADAFVEDYNESTGINHVLAAGQKKTESVCLEWDALNARWDVRTDSVTFKVAKDVMGDVDDDGKWTGDEIPDNKQVFLTFTSADKELGEVSFYWKTINLEEGQTSVVADTVKANAYTGNVFDGWTLDDPNASTFIWTNPLNYTLENVVGGTTYTFYAHFKQDSVPIIPVIPFPDDEELTVLLANKVTVVCVNENAGHDERNYGLIEGANLGIERTGSTTVKVTLDTTAYQAKYNTDTKTKHDLADGQSKTVTVELTYKDGEWKALTNDLPITVEVVCDVVTGFTKELVTDRDLYRVKNLAYPDFYRGTVIVDEGDSVTLLYELTITGDPGAAYTVTDPGADFAKTGVIPDSGTTSFTVAKTFAWREILRADGELVNTAYVTDGNGGTKNATETVDVEIDWDINVPPVIEPEEEFVPKWLNTTDHYAYIVGYEDGTIRPQNNITRAEVATIFFRLLTDNARERYWSTTNDFSDVAAESWYNNAISTLSNMGIINGYEDGTFKPNAPITRAEFTAIATRFFDYEAEYDGAFNDVSARAWYADYVQAAVDMGLVDGYPDGGFHPDAYITRAEACTIVNRVLHRVPHEDHLLAESVMNTWPDNPKSAWYYEDMQEATNSHDYDWIRVDGETVEDWTKKLPERDWSALETEWATAYSR